MGAHRELERAIRKAFASLKTWAMPKTWEKSLLLYFPSENSLKVACEVCFPTALISFFPRQQ